MSIQWPERHGVKARIMALVQGDLPAQPAIGLRLLSQDEDALRPANVDHLAVVPADADSFARPDPQPTDYETRVGLEPALSLSP